MGSYNRTRRDQEILERAKNSPSFTVHLHPEHWTLNNGGKFLYNNPISSLLDDIRAYRIPVDFLDLFETAKVPFFDGCMVVELWDHRPQRPKEPAPDEPEKTRVVLHPNSETLWADLCSLNQRLGSKWTDHDALEVEARLLLATSPPLCLDPDSHLTRIANHILKVTTPTVPISLKRKAAALEPEEDETERARRTKIMQYMAPPARSHAPNYKVLENLQKVRAKAAKPPTPAPAPAQVTVPPPAPTLAPPVAQYAPQARQASATPSTPNPSASQTHSPAESEDAKKRAKLKVPATFPKSQTPVPQPATHQFIQQNSPNRTTNPSPSPSSASPLQPQVYASVHAATEAAKRASTPAQAQSYASPRLPTAVPAQQPSHLQNQPQQRPPSVASYQPTVPNPHFAPQPTRTISQQSTGTATTQSTQAPPQSHPAMHAMYAQQYSQHAQQQQQVSLLQQQQRLAAQQKNGRATPQAVPIAAASPAARASPRVTNQTLAARSPMPQAPAQSVQPMTPHPPPHPQHAQIPYPYTAAHLRLSHQQILQAQLANAAARPTPSPRPTAAQSDVAQQTQLHQPHQQPHQPHQPPQSQAQPQQPQQPQNVQQMAAQQVPHPYPTQMFSYAQMNFQGRMPQYWPVSMTSRVPGMPMAGQPIPGMPGNAQQLNAKAVSNGMPGR